MSELQLRPYQQEDISQLLAIEQSVQFSPWSANMFEQPLGYARYSGWCGEVAGEIKGFYLVEQVVDEITLHNIAVASDAQGKGYGKAMMLHLIEQAQQQSAYQIFLEVRQTNLVAQQLYGSMGFVQVGERKDYYAAPWGRENGLVMVKTL